MPDGAPFGRLPQDAGIEAEILGTILLGRVAALPDLSIDDFVPIEHRTIWREIEGVAATGARPDMLAVGSRLVESATFADPRAAREMVANLATQCTGLASQVPFHAARLRDLALRRRMIEATDRLRSAAQAGDDTASIIAELVDLDRGPGNGAEAVGAIDVADALSTPPPPRQWLYGTTFCRTFLSSLVAPGGTLKTAIRIRDALALATGRKLGRDHVFERCRVLFVSCEDDIEEIKRRVLAAMLHYRINSEELRGWFFIAAIAGKGWYLATAAAEKVSEGELLKRLRATIEARSIDLLIIDPLVKAHQVNENSNDQMDKLASYLAALAHEYNIAIDIPHHTSKVTDIAGNANAGRGASATVNAGRLVRTVVRMTSEEARTLGVPEDERPLLVRIDDAKVNLAPPASRARWERAVGVNLGNADARYPNGDNVHTVEPWEPPALFDGLDASRCREIILAIDAGEGLPAGERYTRHKRGEATRWAGRLIRERTGKTEEQAAAILKEWIANGCLEETEYDSPANRNSGGKPSKALRASHVNLPGNEHA